MSGSIHMEFQVPEFVSADPQRKYQEYLFLLQHKYLQPLRGLPDSVPWRIPEGALWYVYMYEAGIRTIISCVDNCALHEE